MIDDAPDFATATHRKPLSTAELGLSALFWIIAAVLSVLRHAAAAAGAAQVVASSLPDAGRALCWMVATPMVLRATAQTLGERGTAREVQRVVGLGVAVSLAVSLVDRLLRSGTFLVAIGVESVRPRSVPVWSVFMHAIAVYGGVVAVGAARAYVLRYRVREQDAARLRMRLTRAEISALSRQLDPHFLFNTLNLISALVERDARGARRMIAQLSELLRSSLNAASDPEVPLERELELLEPYLDIMRQRYEERLTIEVHVDAATMMGYVPVLILQPLVENAIKHGVEKRRGAAIIRIEAALAGPQMVLHVTDAGPHEMKGPAGSNGMSIDSTTAATSTGIGLPNIAARLDQLYGRTAGLRLHTLQGDGGRAEIRVPFHTEPMLPAVVMANDREV